ncbi:Nrap protein [Dendrothele bispora CBS 962.96]|uniref:U3 small nucleolar RNA-associated protein 22 n=1 Tax=Dendrothele bispora (strain CBS 962.96) TaxID=1314807 RepID=A0A4S8KVU8_DENBC|nr:Nrap protein [Dendrothele bispora CBS 962.96]
MANLKRKRGGIATSRKLRKLSPEEDTNEEMSVIDDGEDNGSEIEEDDDEGEEEEWDGIQQRQQADNLPPFKSLKPTGEEIRVIKDATDLYRSNSFKLQIHALLPNVRPKSMYSAPLDKFLLQLHEFLFKIPLVPPKQPLEVARALLKKGVSVPYSMPLPTEDTAWKVAFDKPSDITLVGSWANKTSVKGQDKLKYGVDLAVEMPNTLFQEKDYLNGRFFHKRAYYLATIAAAIINPKTGLKNVEVSYISRSDDPRLTKLVLEPRPDGSASDFTKLNARVFIIPVLSPDCPIPLSRLSPSHSNIRITSDADSSDDSKSKLPTPLYNTAILTAFTPKSHLLSNHNLQQSCPAFNDALSLLRIWANQRGFGEGSDSHPSVRGFNGKGPWWAALLEFLILGEEPTSSSSGKGWGKAQSRKPLGRGLSSYQLFRAALDFIAKHDFVNEPVFVKTKDGHKFLPDEYQSNHEAVFVDSSSTVNLLADVPIGSLKLLSRDAQKTLETLSNTSLAGDPFDEVFLQDHRDLQTRFDAVIHVDLATVSPLEKPIHTALDAGSAQNAILFSISSLLTRALGNRASSISILHPSPSTRPLSQANPSTLPKIQIGLSYDTEHAFRQVDHGPSAASAEADPESVEKFRRLWGDKAELRRFKDGSITESVVWEVKTVDEKSHIPVMIVRHILKHHFALGEDAVHTWQAPFDSLLRLPEQISRFYVGSGMAMGFKGALGAYDNLVKSVKALDDNELPLTLLNVHPISESLRYTSVFGPVPLTPALASALPMNARYLHPIEFILEFEKSSKWPDELKAIQKIKLAFLERIGSALMAATPGLTASVVIGEGSGEESDIQDTARLEIVTPEGWAFSARIWHDREATLLDRIISGTGSLPHVTTKSAEKKSKVYHDAVRAREVYTRRFIHSPAHHRAIAKLCHHFPAFAGTVRIVKRWFASHWLLHGHISEEAIELLCAAFFVEEGWEEEVDSGESEGGENKRLRRDIPGSRERGFANVIRFLKDWKWEEGLQVPLYSPSPSLTEQDKGLSSKKAEPTTAVPGVWRIFTLRDPKGTAWTSRGPDVIVARRISALAQATWKCVRNMEESGKVNVQTMFSHPTSDYNVLVRLDSSVLSRYHHNVSPDVSLLDRRAASSKKYANEQGGVVIRPGFDPARLLFRDLQFVYTDTFRIFHDSFGSDHFGIVWDPALREPRPFKVMSRFSSLPCVVQKGTDKEKSQAKTGKGQSQKEKDLVVLNEGGVLGEVERLGKGIIKTITVHA